MLVRPRTEDDVAECVRIGGVVNQRDGYPVYLATSMEDFLVEDDALAAWVAEDEGRVVGHVALHGHTLPAAMKMAGQALGRPTGQLAVVARLLVDPGARGRGVGELLLGTSSGEARSRGLWPILDVSSRFTSAIALYERCGWTRVGQVDLVFGGHEIEELVYIGPAV